MFQVKFADIGEGIHEGIVFKIYVGLEGDIKEGESIMQSKLTKSPLIYHLQSLVKSQN